MQENKYINRELSWLQFNARVLQEAADKKTPLIERMRFLGIFSNNLDDFFKVRYATVKRIVQFGKKGKRVLGGANAQELLEEITRIVIQQQGESHTILKNIEKELRKEGIFIVNEKNIPEEYKSFIKEYFFTKISPSLITIILKEDTEFPHLKDSAAYLAIKMISKVEHSAKEAKSLFKISNKEHTYGLIEIPKTLDRFVVLPKLNQKNYIILIDDLIRYCLDEIFSMFDYQKIFAHMIKITRDAELDIDNDLTKSFIEKISSSVKGRKVSHPVRFVYDKSMPKDVLEFLKNKMGIQETDSLIPGARYHNRRDYMNFPSMERLDLQFKKIDPLPVKGLPLEKSLLKNIAEKDYLQYTPYHNFAYLIKFLREAALDPKVKSIKITIYRLAKNSQVVSSLINAAKNGKEVIAQIELQARFDEQANIDYAQLLQNEGVKLIFGVPGLKVHSKICVIERQELGKIVRYGFISTGNFNESSAKLYTDYTLFTAHQSILKELNKVFNFFETNYKINSYRHLIVSPHYTIKAFKALINKEITNVSKGLDAYIYLKMNSLTSYDMINKLYEASRAGVKIKLIIRGVCCLIPNVKGMSENIEAISVVDKFLEHSRIFIFCNNHKPKVYISSADWMTRNLQNRVEVGVSIYDKEVKQELIDTFNICWNDNVKARMFSIVQDNVYRTDKNTKVRSQIATYQYYNNRSNPKV